MPPGWSGQLRATLNLTQAGGLYYRRALRAAWKQETGQATGFKQNGSLGVATNAERFEELKRGASMAKHGGPGSAGHLARRSPASSYGRC